MSFLPTPTPEPRCPEPIASALAAAFCLAETGRPGEVTILLNRPPTPTEHVVCRQHAESLGLALIITGCRAAIRERTGETIIREGEAEFERTWLELRTGLRRTFARRGWPRPRRWFHLDQHPRHS